MQETHNAIIACQIGLAFAIIFPIAFVHFIEHAERKRNNKK